MKATTTPRVRSSSKLVLTEQGHKATVPASALVPRGAKFAKILVPIDFSAHSRKALDFALEFAEQFDSKITLVHVMEPVIYPTDWVSPLVTSGMFPDRKFLLKKLKALTKNQPAVVDTIIGSGRAWNEIVEVAKQQQSDIIIIATHGYSGIRHAVLGSVAEKVVRHAPCPVLTIRADEGDLP